MRTRALFAGLRVFGLAGTVAITFAGPWGFASGGPFALQAKHGYVYTRSVVIGPNGRPIFAEFDAQGEVVRVIGEAIDNAPPNGYNLAAARIMTASAYRAQLQAYEALKTSLGDRAKKTRVVSAREYAALNPDDVLVFAPLPGQPDAVRRMPIAKPALRATTRSVVLRDVDEIRIETDAKAGLILLESEIDLTKKRDIAPDDRSLLIGADGIVIHVTPHNIGFRAAYYKPDGVTERLADALDSTEDDTTTIRRNRLLPWGGIPGATVYTPLYERAKASTDSGGHYRLNYYLPPCPGFEFEHHHKLITEVRFKEFNPRRPWGSYYSSVEVDDTCNGLAFLFAGNGPGHAEAAANITSILASQATSSGRVDLPVDVVVLTGEAVLRNHDGTEVNLGETLYDLTPRLPATVPQAPERAPDAPPAFHNQGLLTEISRDDLEQTELFVYRRSNSQLITHRASLNREEYMPYNNVGTFTDAARFFYKITTRGPRLTDFLGGNLLTWQQTTLMAPALRGRSADHLRPDEPVQIIAINRKTGYMGSIDSTTSSLAQFAPMPQIVLGPPNLKVWAERDFKVQAGDTKDQAYHRRVGHEGDALTSDATLKIFTEWVGQDGSSLPSDLPGYTGRLAKVGGGVLIDASVSDSTAQFDIKPGFHTQVIHIPRDEPSDAQHLYVHVNAQADDKLVDFSPGAGTLQRPEKFVPVLVPIADDAMTLSRFQAYVGGKRRVAAAREVAKVVIRAATFADQTQAVLDSMSPAQQREIGSLIEDLIQPLVLKAQAHQPNALIVKTAADESFVAREVGPRAGQLALVFPMIDDVRTIQAQATSVIDTPLPKLLDPAKVLAGYLLLALDYGDIAQAGGSNAQEALARAAWPATDGDYRWHYRPEYQVSLLQLRLAGLEVETGFREGEPGIEGNESTLSLEYQLYGGPDNPLSFLGLPPAVLIALGYVERNAVTGDPTSLQVGQTGPTATEAALEALMAHAGRTEDHTVQEVLNSYSPSDLLALQLYANQDAANGLYEFVGLPIVIAKAESVEMGRTQIGAVYDAAAAQPATEPHSDSFKAFNFKLLGKAKVSVNILNPAKDAVSTVIAETELDQGDHTFVLSNSDISQAQLQGAEGIDYYIEIKATRAEPGIDSGVIHRVLHTGYVENGRDGRPLNHIIDHDVHLDDLSLKLSQRDFSYQGLGPALTMMRTYSNLDFTSGTVLGQGWRHSLEITLNALAFGDQGQPTTGNIPGWVKRNGGQFFKPDLIPKSTDDVLMLSVSAGGLTNGNVFKRMAAGNWYRPRGLHTSLSETGTGDARQFVYTSRDGTRYGFNAPEPPDPAEQACTHPGAFEIEDLMYMRIGVTPESFRLRKAVEDLLPKAQAVQWIEDRNRQRIEFTYDQVEDPEETARRRKACRAAGRALYTVLKQVKGAGRTLTLEYETKRFGHPVLTSVQGPAGALLSLSYDAIDLSEKRKLPLLKSATLNGETRSYEYQPQTGTDAYNLSAYTDAMSLTTRYAYGGVALPIRDFHPGDAVSKVSTSAQAGEPPQEFSYTGAGAERTVTDTAGIRTVYTLNAMGNPTQIVEAQGTPLERTRKMEWSFDKGQDDDVLVAQTDSKNRRSEQQYDSQGNVTREVDPMGQVRINTYVPGTDQRETETDRNGNTRVTEHDEQGNPIAQTDAEGQRTEHQYNVLGQRTRTKDPRGAVQEYRHDAEGNLTEVIRKNAFTALASADAGDWAQAQLWTLAALTALGLPDAHAQAGLTQPERSVTRYTYDARGRRTRETDPNGNVTQYRYDDKDRLIEVIDSMGGRVRTQYDANGNKSREVGRTGLVLDYEYDSRDRLKAIRRSGSDLPGVIATKTYRYVRGNLTEEADWNGNVTRHEYDFLSRRTATIDAAGGRWTTSYDQTDNKIQETDPLGRITRYRYDQLDRLVEKTQAHGTPQARTWLMAYDAEGHLTHKTDPNGTVTHTLYDDVYRVTDVIEAQGTPDERRTHYDYDPAGNLIAETDALGRVTRHEYDGLGRRIATTQAAYDPASPDPANPPERRSTAFSYDAGGNLRFQKDALGRMRETRYDALNRPSEIIEASGTAHERHTQYAYDANGNQRRETDPRGYIREAVHDPADRVIVQKDKTGVVTTTQYDANGNSVQVKDRRGTLTRTQYDALNRPATITEAYNLPEQRQTTRQYDLAGNLVRITDYRGTQTLIAYDPHNRATQMTEAPDTPDQRITHKAYDGLDNLVRLTDARGIITEQNYDRHNRLVGIIEAKDTPQQRSISRTYNAVGSLIQATDPKGTITRTRYDALNRPVEVTQAANRTPAQGRRSMARAYDKVGNVIQTTDAAGNAIHTTYDALNRPKATTFPDSPSAPGAMPVSRSYDENGNLVEETSEAGLTTRYEYDPENRLAQACNANSECTRYTYDPNGNRISQTLPKGNPTSWEYDALNRLSATITPTGRTAFEYDAAGNRTATVDAANARTESTYDLLNRRTSETIVKQSGNLATQYRYDPNGNRTGMTDAKGQAIAYVYDPLNRLTQSVIPAPPGTGVQGQAGIQATQVTQIAYTYDEGDNLIRIDETKQRPDASTFTDVTLNSYDALNRLTQNNQRGIPVRYSYDERGNRTSVQGPGGTTHYAYNQRNWPTQISPSPLAGEGGGPACDAPAACFSYFPDGKPQQLKQPNGTQANYQYDPANRITRLTHQTQAIAFLDLQYQYDPNGNRTTEIQVKGTNTRTSEYDYDSADRMIRIEVEKGAATTATEYMLDAVGNRTRETIEKDSGTTTKTYDYDGSHWLMQVVSDDGATSTTTAFNYDNNGNLIQAEKPGQVTEYRFDARDQLVQARRDGTTIGTYDYDWRGMRVRQTTTAGTTETIYDGMKVLEEHGQASTRYLHAPGRNATLLAVESDSATEYVHLDALGTTQNLTDASGTTAASYTVDVWGKIESQSGTTTNNQVFTGHRHDGETGLIYMNARYYDPEVGRFISRDPARGNPKDPVSMHPYVYASNSPGSWVDSTGRFAEIGHYYTTFYVVLASGYSSDEAGYMALGSQIPDEVAGLDAINQAAKYYAEFMSALVATGNDRVPALETQRALLDAKANFESLKRVQCILHALCGGDANTQTSLTRESILKIKPEGKNWHAYKRFVMETPNVGAPDIPPRYSRDQSIKLGFLFHRLQDTFAHRRIDNQAVLYEPGTGHLGDWTGPDQIYMRPDLYQQSIDALAGVLHDLGGREKRAVTRDVQPLVDEAIWAGKMRRQLAATAKASHCGQGEAVRCRDDRFSDPDAAVLEYLNKKIPMMTQDYAGPSRPWLMRAEDHQLGHFDRNDDRGDIQRLLRESKAGDKYDIDSVYEYARKAANDMLNSPAPSL